MDTTTLKRGGIVVAILTLILVLSVACNVLIGDDEPPTVSDPDEPFMTYNGFTVTRGDLYQRMKSADGTMQLINMIDEALIEDYIDAVDEDAIEEKILELTYETTDQEEIDQLTEREKEELEQNYEDLVLMSGYDPDEEASEEAFIRLRIAKQDYARDQYQREDEDEPFYIGEEDLESFYEDYHQGDLEALTLRFNDESEYQAVMDHFELVPGFEDGFGRYVGEDDIEDVDDFDEDNTEALDEEETLEAFVEVYNYLYAYRDNLDPDADLDDLLALENDHFHYNQRDLQSKATEREEPAFAEMSDLLYKDLGEAEAFTEESESFNDFEYLFYVLDKEETDDFEELDEETLDALADDYIETLVGDEQVVDAFRRLHEEQGLEIYDEAMAFMYQEQFQTQQELYNEDFDGYIATLEETDIHIDDFFDYMARRVGSLYASDIIRNDLLLQSEHFTEHFGVDEEAIYGQRSLLERIRDAVSEEDRAKNRDLVQSWHDELREYREQVAQFGIDFEVFLQLQFQVSSERAYINEQVAEHIRPDHLLERIDFEADILPYVEDRFENYISLETEELLFYFDFDENFLKDDFEAYYEDLDADEQDDLDTLLADLSDTFEAAAEDEEDLEDLVEEYHSALRGEDEDDDDYSRWARFKNAGIRVEYTDRGELDHRAIRDEPEAVRDTLRSLYESLGEADEDARLSSDPTHSLHGAHLFFGERTEDFERPSAAFDGDEAYDEELENENDLPTARQLEYYSRRTVEMNREGYSDTELPEDLEASLDVLYGDLHDTFFSGLTMTLYLIEDILEGDYEIYEEEAHHVRMFEAIKDLFERSHFPPLEDE